LVYGSLSYTDERKEAKIEPIQLPVGDRQKVAVPTWIGLISVVAGTVLLVLPKGS